MRKASAFILVCLIFAAISASGLRAQVQNGTIQGTVADQSGRFIEGAMVYLSSPSMLGIRILATGKAGGFFFPGLASGVYKVTAEMPGFQTLVTDQIVLRAGMTFFLRLELNPSEKEGEITTQGSSTALDLVASKAAAVLDQALLQKIPLAREFAAVLSIVPGSVSNGDVFSDDVSILGGTVGDSAYVLDGGPLNDISNRAPLNAATFDLIEEVEIISAGQPADQIPSGGAYVYVVGRAGGSSLDGELGLYLINDGFNKDLWNSSQIRDLGTAPPGGDKGLSEASLQLGGAFWPDRAWFFLTGRYLKRSQEGIFVAPFQDILGRSHDNYDWSRKSMSGFFKLTLRPIDKVNFAAWFSASNVYQDVYENPSPRLPFFSTHILDHETDYAAHAALNYDLDQNTLASVRGTYSERKIPTLLQEEALDLPWIDDSGDAYGPLSGGDYNSEVRRKRIQAEASIQRFADNVLGMVHALSGGVDFHSSTSSVNWWRADNLLWHMDSRNPGGAFYPDRGLLAFWFCGSFRDSTMLSGRTYRLGFHARDSVIVGRLALNLGLRFDRAWGGFPSSSKAASGNPLSLFVGDAVVRPYLKAAYPDDFPDGLNPWDQISASALKNVISWNAFSPKIGASFDLWGNGKTVLKASYARTATDLSHSDFMPLSPLYPRNFAFYWLDANGDGRPDVEDEFSLPSLDYRLLSGAFNKNVIAEEIKAPVTEEISLGFEQALFKDLTLSLRYISWAHKNILDDVLYAPDTGEYWYAPGQPGSQKYWIPFTTTFPGTGSSPSTTVTLYARSLDAPPVFMQLRNVPELERKYRGLQFAFHKRMSGGWQLAGSLVLSKAEGNMGGFFAETAGLNAAAGTPNFFINRFGRLDTDRPVQVKLMGTVELPFRISLGALFYYQSGRPWQRWARVLPPADWCAVNRAERVYYTVNLEDPGSRREKAWSSLDLRLEKTWPLGASGKVALYADATNLLGFTASITGLNDIDYWEPAAEGSGQPGKTFLMPDYQLTNALIGKRVFRFGLRVGF